LKLSYAWNALAKLVVPPQDRVTMTQHIFVLNGPNLNLLGQREPDIYGHETLEDIHQRMKTAAPDAIIEFRQSNSEGELVDWVQEASKLASILILNAGAYTHTSVALHDALRACEAKIIEVHISNPAAREPFRSTNYVAPCATASIAGFGARGYLMALDAALQMTA
jgi:3-dehydroquinate dehydratase-2